MNIRRNTWKGDNYEQVCGAGAELEREKPVGTLKHRK